MTKGVLRILVEQTSVSGGDLVTGCINADIRKPFICRSFVLTVTGNECVKWEENSGGSTTTRVLEDEWFKTEIVVSKQTAFQPGHCVFPFQFRMPEIAMSSFQIEMSKRTFRASNECKLEVVLKHDGFHLNKLLTSAEIVVRNLYEAMPVPQPVERSASKNVRILLGGEKAKCSLDARLDRDVFAQGETAQVHCAVWNESGLRIRKITCQLILFVEVTESGKTRFRGERRLTEQDFDGVTEGVTTERILPFKLVIDGFKNEHIAPSKHGLLFVWSYFVRVNCNVAWGRDVVVDIPISIVDARKGLQH